MAEPPMYTIYTTSISPNWFNIVDFVFLIIFVLLAFDSVPVQLKPDCSIEKVNSNHFQEAIDKNIITLSKISHKVPNSFSLTETILVPTLSPSPSSSLITSVTNRIGCGSHFHENKHILPDDRSVELIDSNDDNIALSSTSLEKTQKSTILDADELMIMDATSIDSIDHNIHTEIVTTDNISDESKQMQHFSNDSSEYSNEHVVSSGNASDIITGTSLYTRPLISTSSNSDNIIDVYDSTFHTNATDDNLISVGDGGVSGGFCSTTDENSGQDDDGCPDSDGCDNEESIKSTIALDNIFKIQNFEGVLQIQPHSLIMEQQPKMHSQIIDDTVIVHDDFMISNNMTIGDDSSSSTAALADCSGDNSADTGVEELEPTIQNLEPLEDDPIEQKFTDAENYVLESGEISGDSGGEYSFVFLYLFSEN